MIYTKAYELTLEEVFLELPGFLPGIQTILKLEGLNPAGSIKLKAAVEMIRDAEDNGLINPDSRLIESTSGNLGVALAMVCAEKGYALTIVTDPNTNPQTEKMIKALGATVAKVTTPDANGGFLASRIGYVRSRAAADPRCVWLNQYANPANVAAHRDGTAGGLHKAMGTPDVLVVGVGTSGTLMGCVEYFAAHGPETRIVAVDAEGSVMFGGPAGRRRIPGIGVSRRPEIFRDTGTFEKVVVPEADTIRMCRRVAARYGCLVGGSTGTALVGVERVAGGLAEGSRVVVISPDLGERYLDTVYSDSWVAAHFPEVLDGAEIPEVPDDAEPNRIPARGEHDEPE